MPEILDDDERDDAVARPRATGFTRASKRKLAAVSSDDDNGSDDDGPDGSGSDADDADGGTRGRGRGCGRGRGVGRGRGGGRGYGIRGSHGRTGRKGDAGGTRALLGREILCPRKGFLRNQGVDHLARIGQWLQENGYNGKSSDIDYDELEDEVQRITGNPLPMPTDGKPSTNFHKHFKYAIDVARQVATGRRVFSPLVRPAHHKKAGDSKVQPSFRLPLGDEVRPRSRILAHLICRSARAGSSRPRQSPRLTVPVAPH